MTTPTQPRCNVCQNPLAPNTQVCWVCANPQKLATEPLEPTEPYATSQPSGMSTAGKVLLTVTGSLFLGLAAGVGAFVVLVLLVLAFVASVLTALFEICTGGPPA